jgi:hypothetical protein
MENSITKFENISKFLFPLVDSIEPFSKYFIPLQQIKETRFQEMNNILNGRFKELLDPVKEIF